ncbi:hypothetical protein BASA82_000562 [Batrachochytrium salamandrivorans]|nr:hypothetical protein BASA82_000562 [Batrachochytrium salamandrivorans]
MSGISETTDYYSSLRGEQQPFRGPAPARSEANSSSTAPRRAVQALQQACMMLKVWLEWAWEKALELIELAKSKVQANPRPYHHRSGSDVEF